MLTAHRQPMTDKLAYRGPAGVDMGQSAGLLATMPGNGAPKLACRLNAASQGTIRRTRGIPARIVNRDAVRACPQGQGSKYRGGAEATAVTRETGLGWLTVAKWAHPDALPERGTVAPKASTQSGFRSYLAQRGKEGCIIGRQLLAEIRPLRYAGSLTPAPAAA